MTAASVVGVSNTMPNSKPMEPTKREKLEVLHLMLPGTEWEGEDGKMYRLNVRMNNA
jgi:hypothetical protein